MRRVVARADQTLLLGAPPAEADLLLELVARLLLVSAITCGKKCSGSGPASASRRCDDTMQGMSYVPADDRYERMPYRRCGRSGIKLPGDLARASGTTSATTSRSRPARDAAPRLRPRHHPLRPRQQLRPAVRLGRDQLRPHHARGPRALPRRADHLDQGRLRHVARAVRRVGLAQVPARVASTRAWRGWGSTTSTSSTRTASTPTRRSRRRWARSTPRCARARRSTPASRPTRPSARARRRAILRELGTPLLIHQPSYSMLNRWIEAELLGRARARRASAASRSRRSAQGMLTDRYLDGVPEDSRARARACSSARTAHRREPRARARAQRDRRAAAGRRSRRWRSRGCCATRASPPR